MNKNLLALLLISMFIFLLACGGGGGGSNPVAPAPALGTISGKVAGTGDLSGIPVYLIRTDANIPPMSSFRGQTVFESSGLKMTLTEKDGSFIFRSVGDGDYNILVRKDQNRSSIIRNVSVRGALTEKATHDFLVELTSTGSISGQIAVPDGNSKTGIIVFVTGTSNAAFTAEDGSYRMSGVPIGTFSLAFTAPGLQTYVMNNVAVGSGLNTVVPLVTLSKIDSSMAGIVWKGMLPLHPQTPLENWAYYNTADGRAYIFASGTWQILAQDGSNGAAGPQGEAGSSITWLGTLNAPPPNPALNSAYYNSSDMKAYLWDGANWQILTADGAAGPSGPTGPAGPQGPTGPVGPAGPQGVAGVSISWLGSQTSHPANPQLNSAYYNSSDGKSYIFDGSTWQILAKDGIIGPQGLTGPQGPAGPQGPTGPQGPAGTGISWLGTQASHPAVPQLNQAYYNSTDKKSYIFNGSFWQVLAQDGVVGPQGPVGPQGSAGVSITWLGSSGSHPFGPQLNNAYYNTSDKKSYIYDGSAWQILAQDGVTGPQGVAGISVAWQGTRTTAPVSPQTNWAYYNSNDKKSYVWDGTNWQIIAQDGADGVSIVWKGTLASDPPSPLTNWAYYNSTNKVAYIYDGTTWQILAESVTGPTGPQGIGIVWKGDAAVAPSSPSTNWAYHNTTDGNAYIFDGTSWKILVEGREVDAPVISNLSASAAFGTAVITWETDEPSTSQVEYGLTTVYTATTTIDTRKVTNHSVTISGLSPNTWKFRVRSTDVAGNTGISVSEFSLYKSVTWGGTASESAHAILVADDGNLIITGQTQSMNGDFYSDTNSHLKSRGADDLCVWKVDLQGKVIWKKRLGGDQNDYGYDMCKHGDSSITICGETSSGNGSEVGDKRGALGNYDGWVVHMNSNGNLIWTRCLGSSSGHDELRSVKADYEGGIFLTGTLGGEGSSTDDALQTKSVDAWVARLDISGNIMFYKWHVASTTTRLFTTPYGSNGIDMGWAGDLTKDGGFFFFGSSPFTGTYPLASGSIGATDMWLSRNLTSGLNNAYNRGYGGTSSDDAVDALYVESLDKFALLGQVSATGRDVTVSPNFAGVWVALANYTTGQHENNWTAYPHGRTIDGNGKDWPKRLVLLKDNNLLILGCSNSNTNDFAGVDDWVNMDAMAIKINSGNGAIIWIKKFGGNSFDIFYDAVEMDDGSIYMVGQTYSDESGGSTCPPSFFGASDPRNKGNGDAWMLKVDASGNLL